MVSESFRAGDRSVLLRILAKRPPTPSPRPRTTTMDDVSHRMTRRAGGESGCARDGQRGVFAGPMWSFVIWALSSLERCLNRVLLKGSKGATIEVKGRC
ncbi:hypothetical protein GWI33_004375 [Rhynchophorus ferrugineus]|uniref:Uncharacterized protein n=1 Tax=Rhynchophorus ferrugineus TaxID=354439 RepID=A0A834J2U9_RHYFE|nr:hypothetical protein GWI33_004375 [Rhynchophorus ferrugineus]